MDNNWTKDELVAKYPPGTVYRQIGDETVVLSDEEWELFILRQIGEPKGTEPTINDA